MTIKAIFLALFAAIFGTGALAQGTIQQAGPAAPGHPPAFFYNGLVGDAGYANGSAPNGNAAAGISEFLGIEQGSGNPPYANAGTGPMGTPWCFYDGPPGSGSGAHQLCLGPNSNGGGLIYYNYIPPASPLPFNLCVNGTCTVLPQANSGSVLASRQINSGLTDTASTVDGAIQWNSATAGFKTENLYACGPTVKGYSVIVSDELPNAGTYPIVISAAGGNSIVNGAQNGSSVLVSVTGGGARLICDGVSKWAYFPTQPSSIFHTLNVSNYGAVSDENDSTTCSWSSNVLTCPNKTFTTQDVGKTVAIEWAGTSFNAFVGTIASWSSSTSVQLSASPTTGGPLIHVSNFGVPAASGTGYLVNDTLTLANTNSGLGTTYSAAVGTISAVSSLDCSSGCTTANVAVVAAGSGGTASATCDLIGTTGYAMAGQYVDVNVTLNGSGTMGAGSTINRVSKATYTANLTDHTAEPMAAAGCGPLTGVTMNFPFQVANVKENHTTGFYSAITCSGSVAYTTTTSGSGTGATLNCTTNPAAVRWGTDNTAAFKAAAQTSSNLSAIQAPNCIYIPAGKYMTQPLNTPVSGFGCIKGDAQLVSTVFLIPNIAGDFFSSNNAAGDGGQSQGGTLTYSDDAHPAHAGGRIGDFTCIGMRSSSQIQNCVEVYGSTKWTTVEGLQAFYVRGRGFGVGANANGSGTFWESKFWNNRFGDDGDQSGIPSVDIGSVSATSPNNLNIMGNREFDSWGPAFALYSCTAGGNNNVSQIVWTDNKIEGSGMDGTDAVGDEFQLGRNGCTSWAFPNVNGGVTMGAADNGGSVQGSDNLLSNPLGGPPVTTTCNANTVTLSPYAAIHIYAHCDGGGFLAPGDDSNTSFTANISSTVHNSFGGGIYLDGGQNNTFRVSQSGGNDWNYRAQSLSGASLGSGNMLDCLSTGCTITQSLEASQQPSGASPTSYPVYSTNPGAPAPPLWVGTQAVTNGSNSTNTSMLGTGIGSTRFGPNNTSIGSRFSFTANGVISTPGSGPGTLTFSITLGGTSIAAVTFTPAVNLTNAGFNLALNCTFFTIGPSGTVYCGGTVMVGGVAAPVMVVETFGNAAAASVVDTTSGMVFMYKTQWNSWVSGDTLTNQQTLIQRLN